MLGELFNLLGFFDQGKGERGRRICFVGLLLQFGNYLVELGHIFPDFNLVGALDGHRVEAAAFVQARGIGIAAIGIGLPGGSTESGPAALKKEVAPR